MNRATGAAFRSFEQWLPCHCDGLRPAQAQTLIDSYAEAGVTWWIETLPMEAQAFAPICERVRRGPFARFLIA
jgi:hypothetical protein